MNRILLTYNDKVREFNYLSKQLKEKQTNIYILFAI